MPSNVLFTNPVVAQQSMAQDQFALAQRAQDLADRNALLDNIRQSQETAQKYGAQRYQTDAYRDTAQGQNQIGMMNAQTSQQQGGRRLDLDTVIAENEKSYRANQLATQKAIAEINANASKLRPQDVATIGKTVELHNSQADEFNNTAPNAALIIKNMADELKKVDSEAIKKGEASWNPWGEAKGKVEDLKKVPYSSYVAKALAANPTLVPYVQIDGDKLAARSMKKVTLDSSGRLVEIDQFNPTASGPAQIPLPQGQIKNPAVPQPDIQNPAALIPNLMNANPYPTAAPGTIPSGYTGAAQAPLVMTNRATGRSFKVLGMGGQPVYSQQLSNPAALIPSLSSTNQVPIDWNTNPAYQGQGDMTDWSVQ
jgi:hypothetical protein